MASPTREPLKPYLASHHPLTTPRLILSCETHVLLLPPSALQEYAVALADSLHKSGRVQPRVSCNWQLALGRVPLRATPTEHPSASSTQEELECSPDLRGCCRGSRVAPAFAKNSPPAPRAPGEAARLGADELWPLL